MRKAGGSLRVLLGRHAKVIAVVVVPLTIGLWALGARAMLIAFVSTLPLPLVYIGLTEWLLRSDASAARVVAIMLGRKVVSVAALAVAAVASVPAAAGTLLALTLEPVAYLVEGLRTGNRP